MGFVFALLRQKIVSKNSLNSKWFKIKFFQGSRAKKYFVYFKTDNEEKTNFQPFGAGSDNAPMAVVTRTRFELVLPPWKGGVLTAWPTGHILRYLVTNIKSIQQETDFVKDFLSIK